MSHTSDGNLVMKKIILVLATLLCIFQTVQSQTQDTLAQQQPTKEYRYPTETVITAPRMSLPLKEVPFSASVVE